MFKIKLSFSIYNTTRTKCELSSKLKKQQQVNLIESSMKSTVKNAIKTTLLSLQLEETTLYQALTFTSRNPDTGGGFLTWTFSGTGDGALAAFVNFTLGT